jgi:hypothetical protein
MPWLTDSASASLLRGRVLMAPEQAAARALGVQQPEQVRVVVTVSFTMPPEGPVNQIAGRYGFGPGAAGARG